MKMSFMRRVTFRKSLPIQKSMQFHENYFIMSKVFSWLQRKTQTRITFSTSVFMKTFSSRSYHRMTHVDRKDGQ
jgi:hypothetical protein